MTPTLSMGLLTLAMLAGAPPGASLPQGGEVRQALDRLEAPEAGARLAAERFLAGHLAPEDLPALAERTASASDETLRRLERALGGDERHLELIGLLLVDTRDEARALGQAALTRLVAGWLGERGLDPAPGLRVLGGLAQRGAVEYRMEQGAGLVAPALERLVRLASAGVGRREAGERLDVALDPPLAELELRTGTGVPASIDGDFLLLLFNLTGLHDLDVEGFGLEWHEGANAWLHVTSKRTAGARRADELVAGWMRGVLGAGDPAQRGAAARALAGTGWDAALGWLERRWTERGDGAALEGLALAAARGRVVPSLAREQAVRRLLDELDSALAEGTASGDRRADRARFALAALPPLGGDGSDLTALVAEGLETASPRGRFARLAVLAGVGRMPAATRARLRAWLTDPSGGQPDVVRLEALRALAASRTAAGDAWGRLARASELLELATRRDQAGAISGWMRGAHLGPPPDWRDPARLPAAWDTWQRLQVAEAWLAAPDGASSASAHLLALGAGVWSDPRVELRLRRLASGPLRDALSRALAPEADGFGPGARLSLLAGLLPAARQPQALSALVENGSEPGPEEFLLLGALAAGPVGDGATKALLQLTQEALVPRPSEEPSREPWARGCERAWGERMAAGLDREAGEFLAEVKVLLHGAGYPAQGPGARTGRVLAHPLASELDRKRWPRLAGAEVVPLAELESPLPAR